MKEEETTVEIRGGVVVAGEALIDLIPASEGALRPVPGGGPFNVARTIARLGAPCQFLGALSTDAFGRRLRAVLASDGVDLGLSASTDLPTTLAVAELDEAGAASYQFYFSGTAAASLGREDVDEAVLARAAAFHVGTLGLVMEPIGSLIEALVMGLGSDVTLMVDPNCRPSATPDRRSYVRRVEALVARADIVKASSDDLRYLFPEMNATEAIGELLRLGARLVIATAGGAPVSVAGGDGLQFTVPVPRIQIADTVGSGDAFGGAFLAWFARGGFRKADLLDRDKVEEGVREAIAAAAITSQRVGADPPTRDELFDARAT
jgi:fructokinase